MKVRMGLGQASIMEAQGTVWRETFTLDEAEGIAEAMTRLGPTHIATPLLPAWQRFADILNALTNDSAACIVSAGGDEGN